MDLKELKANGNRPIELEEEQEKPTQIEVETEPKDSDAAVNDEVTKGTEEQRESATEQSSSPKIMEIDETANPGEPEDEPQATNAKAEDTTNIEPIIEEPDDTPISEHDDNRDGDGNGDDDQREEELVEPLR